MVSSELILEWTTEPPTQLAATGFGMTSSREIMVRVRGTIGKLTVWRPDKGSTRLEDDHLLARPDPTFNRAGKPVGTRPLAPSFGSLL